MGQGQCLNLANSKICAGMNISIPKINLVMEDISQFAQIVEKSVQEQSAALQKGCQVDFPTDAPGYRKFTCFNAVNAFLQKAQTWSSQNGNKVDFSCATKLSEVTVCKESCLSFLNGINSDISSKCKGNYSEFLLPTTSCDKNPTDQCIKIDNDARAQPSTNAGSIAVAGGLIPTALAALLMYVA